MTRTDMMMWSLSGLLAAVLLIELVNPADAQRRYRYITVQSIYTSDTASGAVRRARHGWEVRLPTGNWIPCEFNCHRTLRHNTVDFWARFEENSGGD